MADLAPSTFSDPSKTGPSGDGSHASHPSATRVFTFPAQQSGISRRELEAAKTKVTVKPYGTWESPLEAKKIFEKAITLSELYVDSKTGKFYHVESRPADSGRSVLVSSLDKSDVVPSDHNVRTRVHEYGGGSAAVQNGWAVYSDFSTGTVFRSKVDGQKSAEAQACVPSSDVYRYADFSVHPTNSDLILAVREDHTRPEPANVVNELVIIDASTKDVKVVAKGKDFYAAPRFSHSGKRVAWIEWSHPDMPWEGSQLYVADFDAKTRSFAQPLHIAGRDGDESVNQPTWLPGSDDKLLFLMDRTGYLNLWSWTASETQPRPAMPEMSSDLGEPMWTLGGSFYAPLTERDVLIAPNIDSERRLAFLNLETQDIRYINSEFRNVTYLKRVNANQAVFIGSRYDGPDQLVVVTLGSAPDDCTFGAIQTSSVKSDTVPWDYITRGECIKIQTDFPPPGAADHSKDAKARKVDLHCILYPPKNPGFRAPAGQLPPTIVTVHGGPTSRSPPVFNYRYHYFTTRGFAVLDVDYGGSSGYGREYAQRLKSNWGIVDVYDSQVAVTELAKMGKIDGERVAIMGGSAGGYTTLACLTDSKVFAAGISLFGVADVKLLADDTHKFESQYMFKLMGGTPEQVPDVYRERSPLFKAEKITAILLVMQGLDDKVVPPEQARQMVKKIEEAGGDVEAVYYEGEGHGFRKMENLIDMLERQVAFLKRAFKLEN